MSRRAKRNRSGEALNDLTKQERGYGQENSREKEREVGQYA